MDGAVFSLFPWALTISFNRKTKSAISNIIENGKKENELHFPLIIFQWWSEFLQ